MPRYLKYDFLLILFGGLFCAFLEIISISSIIPILNTLQKPDLISLYTSKINSFLSLGIKSENFILLFFLFFIILILLTSISRILLLWKTSNYSAKTGVYLGNKLLESYIFLEYKKLRNLQVSEVITSLSIYLNNVVGTVNRISTIFTSLIIVILTVISLVLYTGFGIIFLFLFVLGLYFISRNLIKKRLTNNSKIEFNYSQNNVNIINHLMRNYREVVLENNQNFYLRKFQTSSSKQKYAMVRNNFYSSVFKFVIEGFSLIAFSMLTLFFFFNSTSNSSLTLIGVSALALQKILPLINQIFQSWSGINSHIEQVEKVIFNIHAESIKVSNHKNINILTYKKKTEFVSLELKNVTYMEDKNKKIFNKLNLKINKGEKIAIIGKSGSGKTTLVEILMGLLDPQEGELLLNGEMVRKEEKQKLQNNFAYVYQNMFIGENSIRKGITAERQDINLNENNYKKAIKISEVESIIDEVLERDNRDIGEYGSKISGGQMQRIALARAIYRDKNIIIFDEATNALDKDLEDKVLRNIVQNLQNKTIIFITHNNTALNYCDRVINLSS